MADANGWGAKGLLFENCNCQLLCRAHVSFRQRCDQDRCIGYHALHIEEGRYGSLELAGLNAFLLTEAPPVMFSGGWTQAAYLDEQASELHRDALERILVGEVGGPWAVLARFVTRRLPTKVARMEVENQGRRKRMVVHGVLETAIEAIRSADGTGEARLENLINQLHGPAHALAFGTTRFADHGITLHTAGTHA